MEPVATDDMVRSDPGEEEAERTARFSILLVCMLVGLMLAPLFGESDTGFTIARIVGVLILVAALSVVGVHRLAIVLFVPTLVVQLVGHRSNVPIVVVTSVILRALFFAYVTGVIVWHVLRKPQITTDAIAGAACAYVLLGLVWANLYVLVERARPGSFDIPGSLDRKSTRLNSSPRSTSYAGFCLKQATPPSARRVPLVVSAFLQCRGI